MAKIGFLDQKPKFWAKKKESLFNSNHVLATTGKSCSKKKSAFAQIIKGGKCHFGWFFGVRPIFRPKTTFRPNVKTPVLRNSGPDRVRCPSGLFLMVRTIPPSFVEIGPKLRVVAPLTWEWPKTAKNRGEPQKMTPSSKTANFLGVVPMGKL